MSEARSTAEYIAFAAKMGAANASLPRATTVKSGTFIKANPEMIVAWREFGMGHDAIAAQLTLVGMPISGATVKDYLPELVKSADKTIVAAIAAQLRLMFMSARKSMAEKADTAYFPTLEIPASRPEVDSVMPSRQVEVIANTKPNPAAPRAVASSVKPLATAAVEAETHPMTTAPSEKPGAKTPVSVIAAPRAQAFTFDATKAKELVSIPGEDEDMSSAFAAARKIPSDPNDPESPLVMGKASLSFGEFRRSLWVDYLSGDRKNTAVFATGDVIDVPTHLHQHLFAGKFRNWAEFTERFMKS